MAEDSKEPPRPPTPVVGESVFVISQQSDIVVSVLGLKNAQGQRQLAKFKVEKKALTSNSAYFTRSLRFNGTYGHDVSEIKLKDDDIQAMRVWFIYMQSIMEREMETAEKKDPDYAIEKRLFQRSDVRDTNIASIWHIINAADKYQLDASILKSFFDLWYEKNISVSKLKAHSDTDVDVARQVVFPCYMFDHYAGFADVTRWLAYNCRGHVTEKRPKGVKFSHMHLAPLDFVGPINHARGGLRIKIHRGIWERIKPLLVEGDDCCTCGEWAETAGHYFAALVKTGAYPLEETFPKSSVNTILNQLGNFKMLHSPDEDCHACDKYWNLVIEDACAWTAKSFDGLCMDCMDKSRPKRENTDVDYWKHLKSVDGRWDRKCRITHGESTWYISWCGRGEHRQKLLEQHKAAKKANSLFFDSF